MFLNRILLLLVMTLLIVNVNSQSLKILTYNIRLDTPSDGLDGWPLRKARLCDQIRSTGADIFGIQEGLPQQVKYIDSSFSGYRHIGVGREDGKNQGEYSAIWYNTSKFKLIKQSTFWLSTTPGKPTFGWDAACKRVCTYGLFREIVTGKQFWVFNTHFDHVGVEARKNSAALILKKIKSLNKAGNPVILMGDFNSGPEDEPVKMIMSELTDSKIADKNMSMGPDGTFNGFDATKPAIDRIDFIFVSKKNVSILNYNVLRELKDGRYPSDHFPVFAGLQF
jgi:endonuclease/exonuclease/phosphatase family metal-dependent hydrolase